MMNQFRKDHPGKDKGKSPSSSSSSMSSSTMRRTGFARSSEETRPMLLPTTTTNRLTAGGAPALAAATTKNKNKARLQNDLMLEFSMRDHTDATAKRGFRVQVPKRMVLYTALVFLCLPLSMFGYVEIHKAQLRKQQRMQQERDKMHAGSTAVKRYHVYQPDKVFPSSWTNTENNSTSNVADGTLDNTSGSNNEQEGFDLGQEDVDSSSVFAPLADAFVDMVDSVSDGMTASLNGTDLMDGQDYNVDDGQQEQEQEQLLDSVGTNSTDTANVSEEEEDGVDAGSTVSTDTENASPLTTTTTSEGNEGTSGGTRRLLRVKSTER